ncbi:MAG: AbrB/MazE/SpoVT family DNA-binding domain-containing protein [Clostridia bacterium]|nr:AbrB/MazE/SpoVT family DNA-binding domain-containing protein [Clostridia bacterium]
MELAKITSKGQITLPIAIRRALSLVDGGKVAFIEKNGQFVVANPAKLAFEDMQTAFSGEADRLGLENIDDVVDLVKTVRQERNGN